MESFRNSLRLKNVQMLGVVQGHWKSGDFKLSKGSLLIVIKWRKKEYQTISDYLSVDIVTKFVILVGSLSLHSQDLFYHSVLSLISQPRRGKAWNGLWFPFPPSQSAALHLAPAKWSKPCLQVLKKCGGKSGLFSSLWESPSQLRCPPRVKLLGHPFSRTKEISPFSRRCWHIHMVMCCSQF